jgi:hypothetical protein
MGWTCQRSVRDVGREGVGLIGQWTVRAGRKLTNPCTAGVMFLLPCEVWSCVRDGMGKLKQDGMINGVDVFLCGGQSGSFLCTLLHGKGRRADCRYSVGANLDVKEFSEPTDARTKKLHAQHR